MTAIRGGIDVTFHGVRGSTPCDGEELARYGGNTSCVSLDIPEHRPLLFFSTPGFVLFLAGLSLGLYVLKVYEATLQLAVGLALLTVLLTLIGVLSIFVGIMLHALRSALLELARRR